MEQLLTQKYELEQLCGHQADLKDGSTILLSYTLLLFIVGSL